MLNGQVTFRYGNENIHQLIIVTDQILLTILRYCMT